MPKIHKLVNDQQYWVYSIFSKEKTPFALQPSKKEPQQNSQLTGVKQTLSFPKRLDNLSLSLLAGDPYIHPKKVILKSSRVIPNLFSFLLLYQQELISDFQALNQHSSYVYPHLFNINLLYIFFICSFLVFQKWQAPNPLIPISKRYVIRPGDPEATSIEVRCTKTRCPIANPKGQWRQPTGWAPGRWKNQVPIGCCLARPRKLGFPWWSDQWIMATILINGIYDIGL